MCAAVGPNQIDALANAVIQRFKESGAVQEQVPGRDERRRKSEEEQEQGRASQQVRLPTPGGFIQGASVSSLDLDLPLVRGALGQGGSAGRSGKQRDRKRGPSRSPGRHSMDEGADDDLGGMVPFNKKERKTVRERTQEPLKETVREGTSGSKKEIARVRPRGPLKYQLKGGGFRQSEAQKKFLVDTAQSTVGETKCVGKERRGEGKKAKRGTRVPRRNNFWEDLEDGSSFF